MLQGLRGLMTNWLLFMTRSESKYRVSWYESESVGAARDRLFDTKKEAIEFAKKLKYPVPEYMKPTITEHWEEICGECGEVTTKLVHETFNIYDTTRRN